MCGIAGYWTEQRAELQLVEQMAAAMPHRGPDHQGAWVDEAAGVALGHRRLSILDVSASGNQPMASASGRFWISFNGEIYNFGEIKQELGPGVSYRGSSDTEVMLAAFERWGVLEATGRLNGMFAFGVWDSVERVLYLGRDRFGEKPVYYQANRAGVVFASELKALRRHPLFDSTIDSEAVGRYFRESVVPAPQSVYRNTKKLPPGCVLVVRRGDYGFESRVTRYWSSEDAALSAAGAGYRGSYADAVAELEELLTGIVRSRMVADVPLGAFLSGGIDSSMIVALMQKASSRPVKTFTIGFHDKAYNEAEYARAVARHIGTEHTELYVGEAELLGTVPLLHRMFDEPFADSSQIPTYLVAKMAREHVTVSLSGDAGDEFCAGYRWYPNTLGKWMRLRRAPAVARRAGVAAARLYSALLRGSLVERLGGGLPEPFNKAFNARKVAHKGEIWSVDCFERFYLEARSSWQGEPSPVDGLGALNELEWKPLGRRPASDLRYMMLVDTVTYLPDDILVKVDRATMAVSLESRAPFLDPELYRFLWSLPDEWLFRGRRGKLLLREVLYRHVPRPLMERNKKGFAVPMARWLRQELRDWAEDLMSERALGQSGLLNVKLIRQRWQEHLRQQVDWSTELWIVLQFQDWYRHRND
jgi:asparagine synthase (glutamine-hydrolysing)